jgi:cyclic pyranopterin phosphate synthase
VTLTTNGTLLSRYASELAECGVRRINISLDSLDPDRFRRITRRGDLAQVMRGIDAAQSAGMKVKINAVALKGVNEDEIEPMVAWAHGRGMDLTFIEVMPLGDIEPERIEQFMPLSVVRERIAQRYSLDRHERADRRAGALCAGRRDGGPDRLHHAPHP